MTDKLHRAIAILSIFVAASAPALGACVPATLGGASTPSAGARLEPISGAYFGVNLDWDSDSPADFNRRLEHRAAVYVRFFPFPLAEADLATLDVTVKAIAAEGGMLLITLEPAAGLGAVTHETASVFAASLARVNSRGVSTFVRFAHEMNGSWYPWSQQPVAYVAAFRTLASAVHSMAPNSAMLWAPNYGGGYPFEGGRYAVQPGSADFSLLDTNSDNRLDMADDPYGPYYPGDDAVDWVGLSLYHWGNQYPWGDNEVPEPGKFAAQLRGVYDGLNGDDSALPNFYEAYWTGRHKPIAIPETAAFYDPSGAGATELNIKQAWWRQVLDHEMLTTHPGIKMINWFEWLKPEAEVGGSWIDWRVLGSPEVAAALAQDLPLDGLIFGR